MKKHSQSNRCVLKFSKNDSNFDINYRDNGVGVSENAEVVFKNGLNSILERLETYRGVFKIKNDSGLQIEISIPKKSD
jgi:signal transduction histidine kinase